MDLGRGRFGDQRARGFGIEHVIDGGNFRSQFARDRAKTFARDHQAGAGIGQDIGHFGRSEPPPDRRHHHADPRGGIEDLEIDIGVLADPGHAIALLQSHGGKQPGNAPRVQVHFGKGGGAITLLVGDGIATHAGPVVEERVERLEIGGFAHALPFRPLVRACRV